MPWAIQRCSNGRLDGKTDWIMRGRRGIFNTRTEARAYLNKHHGWMRRRLDLRAKPHGWKMPRVVRVTVTIEVVE